MTEKARLVVRQITSEIGYDRHPRTPLHSLGLRRMHQSVELEDTPSVRGMVRAVRHLVVVEDK